MKSGKGAAGVFFALFRTVIPYIECFSHPRPLHPFRIRQVRGFGDGKQHAQMLLHCRDGFFQKDHLNVMIAHFAQHINKNEGRQGTKIGLLWPDAQSSPPITPYSLSNWKFSLLRFLNKST
jgi:hypothetical protein